MCGLVGYSGSFEPSALRSGLQRLAHRGPDDSGVFIDENAGVGLAHARLSILDLSPLGHQPMASQDGAVTLVFNGEIYNFRELRAELESKGHRFRGHSDTEVLVSLYLEEGAGMLPRLNGIFALALWDSRDRSMLLARDALGVKPLYVATTPRGVAFGSEIKALVPLLPASRELDHAALHRYLSFQWCPGDGTPLRNVRKLAPGEAVILRAGAVERRWTWYTLPATQEQSAVLSFEDALEGTVHHLRQAVHRQMVADVPVGAFLSGGLDSSAVVAFAREVNPAIECFTIQSVGGSEEGMTDDLPYARQVAEHLKVPLHVVTVDAGQMAENLQSMVVQLDEPLGDPAPLNVLYISQLARRHGMKVLLSGAGGDDLFTGYRRHVALSYEGLWRWLPLSARAALANVSSRLDKRRPAFRRVGKLFENAAVEGNEAIASHFLWSSERQLLSLYSPLMRESLGTGRAIDPMLEFLGGIAPGVPPIERMLALEQRFFLTDHNLTYTDKMSMAVGVEARVPFLDLDLVDFASRVPVHLKQRGAVGKWILKKAMEPFLPEQVIYRPKTGFGAPLRRWIRHELRPLLADVLSADSLSRRGLFDAGAVGRLIADNESGRVDASYTLLSLMCIEIWCREFVDAR